MLTEQEKQLFEAARKGDIAELKELIEKDDADVNARNQDGQTPLHIAAKGGHKEIVDFLITKGAEIDAKDYDTMITPLYLAVHDGHREIVKFRIEKGANIHVVELAFHSGEG